ncbi:MAG: hypothetical protein JNN12_07630 [Bacteroidetes Order II. Incertae sedis bacterium]|nr:hypothetical protein [Bacteroidetes Order II. bacterium]
MDKSEVIEMLKMYRFNSLVQKAELSDDFEALSEEINATWWEKNKARLLGEERFQGLGA